MTKECPFCSSPIKDADLCPACFPRRLKPKMESNRYMVAATVARWVGAALWAAAVVYAVRVFG